MQKISKKKKTTKQLNRLDINKTTDPNGLSPNLLHSLRDTLARPLTTLCEQTLNNRHVIQWEVAVMTKPSIQQRQCKVRGEIVVFYLY